MTNIKTDFWVADDAFRYLYKTICKHGIRFSDTRALFNVGFTILKPQQRIISEQKRNWKLEYAEAEWQWYLSGDRNIKKLGEIYGKVPEIWKRMADDKGNVNSNYGWQWKRNNQIDKVIQILRDYRETRQATISIYDGKEIDEYKHDTPCTHAIQFTIVQQQLHMCVSMRSNDLWYGFCNDQYQFSKLQEMISKEIGYEMGTYYHFAHNMHIYNDKIGL